ncbi:MAG: hypothetical protein Q8R82_14265 [Hyphomonadaceae bacterium]|nr:hypothetical protein [Hyphomonadaceae bacterium]
MNKIDFYKEFYLKELGVKNELNNAINIPIIIISSIVALHMFILSTALKSVYFYQFDLLEIVRILSFINFAVIVCALFYLAKSYMNLGFAYTYIEIGDMLSFYKYDKDLIKINTERDLQTEKNEDENSDETLPTFEEHLEKELAASAANYFNVNTKRTTALATAKKFLFGSIAFTLINSTIFIILIVTKNQI